MKKVVAALDYEKHAPSSFHARCCRRAPPSFVPPPAAMAPAAIKTTREPKPWDKLRRNRSQPSSPTERAPSSPDAAALSDGVRSLDVSPDGSANDRGARAAVAAKTAAREPAVRGRGVPAGTTAPAEDAPKRTRPPAPRRMVLKGSKMVPADDPSEGAHAAPGVEKENVRAAARDENAGAAKPVENADGGSEFTWLLQRQVEVEMSLRGAPLASRADVDASRARFDDFVRFFARLRASADALGPECRPATLFQELLHRVAGRHAGVTMDEQGRDGDVPMHQAKVLDRREARGACAGAERVVGAETMKALERSLADMRLRLRVKMEDANDVRMAEEAVKAGSEFFERLARHAEREKKDDFEVLLRLRDA